jgi:small conductance mechanosensitive channel
MTLPLLLAETHDHPELPTLPEFQTFLDELRETLAANGVAWFWKIVAALVILFVGHWLAHIVVHFANRALKRTQLDTTLRKFFCRVLQAFLLLVVVISVLNLFGVQTASFVAVLGTIGLAVGLALQGSLSNFAAGVLLVLLRPFKVDDSIEVASIAGTVDEISIFSTLIRTSDNRTIAVPNSTFIAQPVTNVTAKPTRRIDLTIGVSYSDDLKTAKAILQRVLAEDSRVLLEPAPAVVVGELGDNAVNFYVRPWVKTADYWSARWDLLEKIKVALEEGGCSIPFPQHDVHVIQPKA